MELGIGEMSQIHLIIAKTCFSYIGLYIFDLVRMGWG